jgi:hypothetical protein
MDGHRSPPRPIAGAPRFAIERVTVGHAYARSGNAHNPTPRYSYRLLLDGKPVDESTRERALRDAAKAPGAVKAYSA